MLFSPSVEIVARAEQMENVTKIYRAGADYVLSLATVSGRMLATTVIEDGEVISLNTQIEVVRTPASRLAGQRLEDARIRSRTGCTIVGVERNGDVITELDPEFRIEADDLLIVVGTDERVNRFNRTVGVTGPYPGLLPIIDALMKNVVGAESCSDSLSKYAYRETVDMALKPVQTGILLTQFRDRNRYH